MMEFIVNTVTDMRVITCLITIFLVVFFFRTVFFDVKNFIIFILLITVIYQMSYTPTVIILLKNISHGLGNVAYGVGDYIETGIPTSNQEV